MTAATADGTPARRARPAGSGRRRAAAAALAALACVAVAAAQPADRAPARPAPADRAGAADAAIPGALRSPADPAPAAAPRSAAAPVTAPPPRGAAAPLLAPAPRGPRRSGAGPRAPRRRRSRRRARAPRRRRARDCASTPRRRRSPPRARAPRPRRSGAGPRAPRRRRSRRRASAPRPRRSGRRAPRRGRARRRARARERRRARDPARAAERGGRGRGRPAARCAAAGAGRGGRRDAGRRRAPRRRGRGAGGGAVPPHLGRGPVRGARGRRARAAVQRPRLRGLPRRARGRRAAGGGRAACPRRRPAPGRPGAGRPGAAAPDPVYGAQLQDHAIRGHAPEAAVAADWEEIAVALSGGETATLRRPSWRAEAPAYGPLADGAALSARLTPPLWGLGLLEAIPDAAILALADPGDADGDGIAGRAAILPAGEDGRPALGRFGWKAAAPSLAAQTAAAFAADMGLSTPALPAPWGDCAPAQAACRAAPAGGDPAAGGPEVSAEAVASLLAHLRALPPPSRRAAEDPETRRGEAVFHAAGCAACHVPEHVARPDEAAFPGGLRIRPYTDLLLHDLGEGLADGLAEGAASGREWRTAPLWGLGRADGAAGAPARLLHDGRARSPLEAILWHGGAAQAARDAVAAMPREDRAALLRFLASL